MSKRTLTIVVLCLAALFYLAFMVRPRGAATAIAASDVAAGTSAGDQAKTAVPAAGKTERPSATKPAPAPQVDVTLSADERETLVMYDEMKSAFEQFHTDCLRMGEAIDVTVTAHTSALTRLRDKRDSMTVEQQVQATQRVEAAEGQHLKELRAAMEQAVAKCKQDLTLRDALRRLATLNAPRGARPTQ
jgi:hypothetical protein